MRRSAAAHFQIANRERLEPELGEGLRGLEKDRVVPRIWDRDWTVWKDEDREISSRLGWLSAPAEEEDVPDLEAFAADVRREGLARAVVLGMGGSSLAPEVLAGAFKSRGGSLELEVLDTTEPGTVAAAAARLDLLKTLFVVSSKSGTTAELVALLSFFYDRTRRQLGDGRAGSRFVAVTDPGTPLESLANSFRFRRTFRGRPDIGGRFSALSVFGLLPAALKGIDLRRLLRSGRAMAEECRDPSAEGNPGALLGAVLGTAAGRGRNKLTLFPGPGLPPLAAWLEQLVAESTGKEGRGIVPVIEPVPGPPAAYGPDRLFVELRGAGDTAPAPEIRALIGSGAPLVRLILEDPYALGGHFFLWEFATAVAARFLGINPFDQPDVESAKKKTREVLAGTGGKPACAACGAPPTARGLRILAPGGPADPRQALNDFLGLVTEGDYVAVLAFLPPGEAVEKGLAGLAGGLRRRTRTPVTVGFGPRYLHSTGQLHKGDANSGLFLMLTEAGLPEVPIPVIQGADRPAATFGDLFAAQSLGDGMALADRGRRVLKIELEGPAEAGLRELASLMD